MKILRNLIVLLAASFSVCAQQVVPPLRGVVATDPGSSSTYFSTPPTSFNVSAASPSVYLCATGAGTNLGCWTVNVSSGGNLSISTVTDALGAGVNVLSCTRGTTTNVSACTIGNATSNPTFQFLGSGLVQNGAANASISSAGTVVGVKLSGTTWSQAPLFLAAGTKFAAVGSGGGCGTIGTTTGGATSGKFVTAAVTACQVTVTFGGSATATNDSSCWATDDTHPADVGQVTSTSTTVTINFPTITAGDTIKFGCMAS